MDEVESITAISCRQVSTDKNILIRINQLMDNSKLPINQIIARINEHMVKLWC